MGFLGELPGKGALKNAKVPSMFRTHVRTHEHSVIDQNTSLEVSPFEKHPTHTSWVL